MNVRSLTIAAVLMLAVSPAGAMAQQTTASPTPTPTADPTPVDSHEKKDPGQIWDSFLVFVSVITMAAAGIAGLGSRSMAVGALAAYSVFAYITIQTGHTLLTNILYVTLVIVIIGMAFKMWRTEFGGEV